MANTTVTVYANTGLGGKSQEISANNPDLTKTFTDGANSISLGDGAGTWQAFTQTNYNGPHNNLNAGQQYNNPGEMGLGGPVKSMRKA